MSLPISQYFRFTVFMVCLLGFRGSYSVVQAQPKDHLYGYEQFTIPSKTGTTTLQPRSNEQGQKVETDDLTNIQGDTAIASNLVMEFTLPAKSSSERFTQPRDMQQQAEENVAIAQDITPEETQQVIFQFDFEGNKELAVNQKILRNLTSDNLNQNLNDASTEPDNFFQTIEIAGRNFLAAELPVRIFEENNGSTCKVEGKPEPLPVAALEKAKAVIQRQYFNEGYLLNFVNCFTIGAFEPLQEFGNVFSDAKRIVINVNTRTIDRISYRITEDKKNAEKDTSEIIIDTSEKKPIFCNSLNELSSSAENKAETESDLNTQTEETIFLKEKVLCDRLRSILGREGDIIHYREIEDNLAYWKTNPLIDNIEVYLSESENTENAYDLNIVIDPEEEEQLLLGLDNSSPESVGDEKFSIAYVHNNPEKVGDRFILGYTGTTSGGIRAVNFGYEIPLGVTDKYLAFNFAPSWTKVTQRPFSKFDITARSQLASVEYRHPLIRSLEEELSFSLGFEYQNGRTFIFNDIPTAFGNGSNDDGITRTSYFTFGQRYARRSPNGAWAIDSKFTFGTDLFGATAGRWNEPGGIFNSWKLFGQRIQKLGKDHKLVIEAQLQLSPKTLPSSYQFSIGGPNTVRGYRSNARTADNGFRFSIEDYIVLDRDESGVSHTEIIPFIDLGYVWNNPDTSNGLLDQTFLLSAGIGFQWYKLFGFDDLTARLDIAYPFFNIDDRGQALQDDGIYFSINYNLF
ncbi:hypothetical protein NIES208_03955 [[Limnothrix rosea] IAM M-220]|nr:hypothetical protein NIES208_03955 [[Limnothrix rosea] IAM M-220]